VEDGGLTTRGEGKWRGDTLSFLLILVIHVAPMGGFQSIFEPMGGFHEQLRTNGRLP
jgi:hypothetical protein